MKNIYSKIKPISLFVSILLLLSSCGSKKSLIYMRDIDEITISDSISDNNSTIQVGDHLGIWVSAEDADAVAAFNQNISQAQIANFSQPSGNIIQRQVMREAPTYIVSSENTINFPVLGNYNTKGITPEQLEKDLTKSLLKYVVNPNVQARTLNFKITILGEVARPGTFNIPDGQATLLSALGMAGDLTPYAEREEILLVRNENGKISKHKINLNSAEFINSPYYFLKQNDVIYAYPNKTIAKRARLNPNNGLYISIASIALAIITLLIR